MDIKVTTICDMVTNTASTYDTGYRILVSEENTVLAHKNADSVLKKYNEIGVSDALLNAIDNVIQRGGFVNIPESIAMANVYAVLAVAAAIRDH